VLSDSSRQVVVECFLGLRLNEHFPSLTLPYQGERVLPLGEPEDDEADLENSPPSTLKDKVGSKRNGCLNQPISGNASANPRLLAVSILKKK